MPYKVAFDEADGIVRTTCTGELTADLARAASRDALACGRTRGTRLFLFDNREAVVTESDIGIFSLMSNLGSLGFDQADDRVALVFARQAEDHRFAETVALNRAWFNFRFFAEFDEALAWLRENKS